MSASQLAGPSERTLELARLQKIQNLKLKTACLENEELIQELHVTDVTTAQQNKLHLAHGKAKDLLENVEKGVKWQPTESYNTTRVIRQYNLQLTPKDISKPEDHCNVEGIDSVLAMLSELKQHPNKQKIFNMTIPIDNAIMRLEKIKEDLTKTQVDATEFAEIPLQVIESLQQVLTIQPSTPNLQTHEEEVNQLKNKIERVKELRDVALADGEMNIAEEQYYLKSQLLEQLQDLIRDKFRLIQISEEENRGFKTFSNGATKCFAVSRPMRDKQLLKKRKCDGDMKLLVDAIQKLDLEDAESIKTYSISVEKSDKFLTDNELSQESCWKQIHDLEKQLQKLGASRFEEVKRRIEEHELEERRKTEYNQSLDALAAHKKLLDLTIFNCDCVLRSIDVLEDMVSDLGNAIRTRYSKCSVDVGEIRLNAYCEYLDAFTRLYKTLGQLVYKKEKKIEGIDAAIRNSHMQLEVSIDSFNPHAKKHSELKKSLCNDRAVVEEEVQMLKDKLATAEEQFQPIAAFLRDHEIPFSHPADIVENQNMERREKLLKYRSHLHKAEEVKLLHEKEEIKKAKSSIAMSPNAVFSMKSPRDPYSPSNYTDHQSPKATNDSFTPLASPPANNPRKVLKFESPVSVARFPQGRWKADLMDHVVYYDFIDSRRLRIDFTSAGLPMQEATYELVNTPNLSTIDIHMPSVETKTGERIGAQTQRMLFRWLGQNSFQLQMNIDASVRPTGFHEGVSVVFHQ